jgi:antitoxin component of MazEF toxin-antitoxin module
MVRYRQVKKWGNSLVIVLDRTDVIDLNIKVGDLIDVEDAIKNTSIHEETAKQLKIKLKQK